MVQFRLLHRLFRRKSHSLPGPPEGPSQQASAVTATAPVQVEPVPASPLINPVANWSRALLNSTGLAASTCQVAGDLSDPSRVPILPPDYSSLVPRTSNSNSNSNSNGDDVLFPVIHPQVQSPFFFRLPPEIRHLIYLYAFGDRRVHIDFDFHPAKAQWSWWHRVCDDPVHCPDKEDPFVCPEYEGAEEAMLKLGTSAWVKNGFEYKVDAVSWLQSCWRGYLESLSVLYATNSFVLTHGIDQLFRFSRILPSQHLALITTLIIEIDVYRASKGPPDMEPEFRTFYDAFFGLLCRSLPGLQDLRLSLAGLPNRGGRGIEWSQEGEWQWIGPWEALAQSRRWKRLEIAVPKTWIGDFEGVVERRSRLEEGRRYRLVAGVDLYPRGW
ncbi:hypothetical protein BO70DRAFT_432445 [Aspergillus heteromorphus CBS 117.55]|uniref:DUF7730 domain-containing protein n=1 Tax=Aspergillus heteromorphus CBS 117.55 TaxID=1448321 RepID=A0A317V610_9EURO|nr:uncharacterized protein BO70DRAFT_432445 [Aspergillus heteromorphus CBS 117.55]PWY69485.1 hypothetical protein BO70DRAFT_432445 [Aspergillus heteromorphus CBS 117.55]